MRLPGGDLAAKLADRLHALDYTVEGVRHVVGDVAARALDRGEWLPASRHLTDDRSALATVVRCFMLAEPVEADQLVDALRLPLADLCDLVTSESGQATATVDLAPCALDDSDLWIASDWSSRRTGRTTASDHVLGVGGASLMLAQCTVRPAVARALDVGTGCGVQALQLAAHAGHVVATDVSPRALELAAFNAGMNGVPLDLRAGDLFDPVADEQFDLVVSNPPFVIGSPAAGRREYRDFGGAGDAVCEAMVSGAGRHLAEGGWCQLLANWEVTDPDDWSMNPRGWVAATDLDAWVIQREVQDPAEYVGMWLRDAGEQRGQAYAALYDEWLSILEARAVRAIGFGLITLRRGGGVPVRRFQHVPQTWSQPVAGEVERWFEVQDWLATDPSGPLTSPLALADDVVLEQHRWSTAEPVSMVSRTSGMRWSGPVDAFGIDVLAGLDGKRPAGEVVVEVAARYEISVETALDQAISVLGRLAEEGFVRRRS